MENGQHPARTVVDNLEPGLQDAMQTWLHDIDHSIRGPHDFLFPVSCFIDFHATVCHFISELND